MTKKVLILVPVFHSLADLGSVGEHVEQQRAAAGGIDAVRAQEAKVEQLWDGIEQALMSVIRFTGVPMEQVRIYQDGLPVCDQERKIVDEVAAKGSRNYQLVARLTDQGAQLTGTESATLLQQELALQQAQMADQGEPAAETRATTSRLLQERDAFIARRIQETLQTGELGVLFIGLSHDVPSHLGNEVHVRPLFQVPAAVSVSSRQ
ncbi:hypothetical protein [Ectothiorhodospira shaposhnikovii]|uniref:hypothetical protein n=1 Tax=Ectothiorhodospira shaposhnikovii TaxID=1054 RepID=UPI001EE83E50|nr:hypothetical protein [Ectothiorhodospira shaposhnikovii]MCG5514357.1 hypothetical protein [Ectothiorhodospira shaposhnikovii]